MDQICLFSNLRQIRSNPRKNVCCTISVNRFFFLVGQVYCITCIHFQTPKCRYLCTLRGFIRMRNGFNNLSIMDSIDLSLCISWAFVTINGKLIDSCFRSRVYPGCLVQFVFIIKKSVVVKNGGGGNMIPYRCSICICMYLIIKSFEPMIKNMSKLLMTCI